MSWSQVIAQTVEALLPLWQLWLFLAGALAIRFVLWILHQRRVWTAGIAEIDRMDGESFERRLALLFRALGYDVRHVGRRGDYGADLVVAKSGRRTVVQAKRWSKNVGVKAVQEAYGAVPMHDCDGAMVVTNTRFTRAARELADKARVELWDRDRLVQALASTRNA